MAMEPMDPMMGSADPQQPLIEREAPQISPAREELVKQKLAEVKAAKAHWDKKFKRMRRNMQFVRGKQWPNDDEGRYIANITLRHIQQRTAALYAKNPRAVFKQRARLEFQVWDGDPRSLAQAQQTMQAAAGGVDPATGIVTPPAPPEAVAGAQQLLADVQNGMAQKQMLQRVGRTLQAVFEYSISEPKPKFKPQLKQAVRRALTTGVAYCKLGYQRVMDYQPQTKSIIEDDTRRLQEIQRLAADIADDKMPDDLAAEYEELQIKLRALQEMPDLIVREGLVFSFPRSTAIIVDPACTQLKGFIDGRFVAEEYVYSPNDIKELFGVDVSENFTAYTKDGLPTKRGDGAFAMVYEIYDLIGRIVYYVCDGYPDFLKEPGNPDINLEQFHPYFVLSFNDLEDEDDPFPPSNVDLIEHQQLEINRTGEAKREHRQASRPAWVYSDGALDAKDKLKFATHETHELIPVKLPADVDIKSVLQPKPTQQLDPTIFETESTFADALRVTGDQEANFGGTSDSTATESTIAENTRISTLESNKDDLDEFLSDIAEASGQILLLNMDAQTATEIAGPGAVWPTLNRTEVARQLYLQVAAGSSGRPNRALDIANTERMAPFILQTPGVDPAYLARRFVTLADSEAEWEEVIDPMAPSVTQMNAQKQMGTGDPQSDPNAQAEEGDNQIKRPPNPQTGPRPPAKTVMG